MTEIHELVARISKESGKTPDEIHAMMEKRKEATHGLLSDYGAIYAVAKEFGINLNDEKTVISRLSEIEALKSFNVAGRVKAVFPPREFQRKDGSTGRFASAILVDSSGEGRVVFWDTNTEIVEKIKRGDILLIRNAFAKQGLNGSIELHAGSLTSITVNPELDLNLPEIEDKLIKINELKKDMQSIDILCRVNSYYPATEFTRSDGSKGLRASFIAEDETGTIRVVLWGEAAKMNLNPGDFVRIENAYTREGMNKELEIQVGNKGRIIRSDEKLELSPLEGTRVLKINEIDSGINGFTTAGRVLQIFRPRAYSNGIMASLIIGDDSGIIRAVLWDEKAEIANELEQGNAVKLSNVYSKTGINGIPEIHVGRYSTISVNPEIELPSVKNIEESLLTEKKIIDLNNNDRYVRISGRIAEIDEDRRITYMTCPNCSRRVQSTGNGWFCESCNEEVIPVPNLVISVTIEDNTSSIRAVAFGNNAEKILGMDIEEVMNLIGKTQDEYAPVKEAKDELLNKDVSLSGRVRYNNFSDRLEFIVEGVEFL